MFYEYNRYIDYKLKIYKLSKFQIAWFAIETTGQTYVLVKVRLCNCNRWKSVLLFGILKQNVYLQLNGKIVIPVGAHKKTF